MKWLAEDAQIDARFIGPPLQEQLRLNEASELRKHMEETLRRGLEEALGPIDWQGLPYLLSHLSSEVVNGITVIRYKGREVLEVHSPEITYASGADGYSMNITQRYRALTRP